MHACRVFTININNNGVCFVKSFAGHPLVHYANKIQKESRCQFFCNHERTVHASSALMLVQQHGLAVCMHTVSPKGALGAQKLITP